MLRGGLEAVNMRVKCQFIKDALLNKEFEKDEFPYEIRVELEEMIKKKLKDYDD